MGEWILKSLAHFTIASKSLTKGLNMLLYIFVVPPDHGSSTGRHTPDDLREQSREGVRGRGVGHHGSEHPCTAIRDQYDAAKKYVVVKTSLRRIREV